MTHTNRSLRRRALVLLPALAALALAALSQATPVLAAGPLTPTWQIGVEVAPTNLPPQHEGNIIVAATNLGSETANGASAPIVIADKLPPGLNATAISSGNDTTCSTATVQCTFKGTVYPYERTSMTIRVKVAEPEGTSVTLTNEATVEGGGALEDASAKQPMIVTGAPTQFGVQNAGYQLEPLSQAGTAETTAGAHPFQLTTTFIMNQTGSTQGRQPAAPPRNLTFRLPEGLVGDASATEQCPMIDFFAHAPVSEVDQCPPDSAVGVATVTIDEPETVHVTTLTVPVFNLVAGQDEPARFGFEALGLVPVVIDTSVSPEGGYRVLATVRNATELAGFLSSEVTLWGVPGDPLHNASRGWECVQGGVHFEKGEVSTPCPAATSLPQTPFLTLPTACAANPAGEPVASSVEAESWATPGYVQPPPFVWSGPLGEALGFTGCSELAFEPSIGVSTQTHAGAAPASVTVSVHVPSGGLVEAHGRAQSAVRNTTVTLPEGVVLNPSAANGLQACSEQQVGFEGLDSSGGQLFSGAKAACPQASKLGSVHIRTPLLPHELEGALYLATPAPNGEGGQNPFNDLIAEYLVAEGSGVLVKLAGSGHLNPDTGQLETTFSDTPQLPFEELKLELLHGTPSEGGERAALATPPRCGSYSAQATFTSWAQPEEPVMVSSPAGELVVGEDCAGAGPLSFAPSFLAQSTDTQAGAFSPFTLEITRHDQEQALTGVSVSLPAGIAALLSSVTPCQEPPAGVEWSCGSESQIGESTAESGFGSEPIALHGQVFLTSGYDGAPFGLLVRTLAAAGPFDLGYVNVRSRINVNPETAAVTITTDPGPRGEVLPTFLKGVPAALKRLVVDVNRPNFEFNPTSCEPASVNGTLHGAEGASAGVSSRFQVGGCESLPFHPELTATVSGHANKADGTGFDVKLTSAGLGQANIKKVELQLPGQLPSRQSTLNQACLAAVFQANPASCPEGSVIGSATVHTPVLKSPLSGPAYLVSYGNAKFPDVEFVLQGEGITLVLDGHTDIKKGVTYSKFETAPDAPFTTFETSLPAGPHGILTAYASEKEPYELCRSSLTMPTTITAQDGAVIQQTTTVTPTSCSGVLPNKTSKPTQAQQLAKALAACRKKYKHKMHKKAACEASARKRYAPKKKSHGKAHKARKTTAHPHG